MESPVRTWENLLMGSSFDMAPVWIKFFEESPVEFRRASESFFAARVRRWGEDSHRALRDEVLSAAAAYERTLQNKTAVLTDAKFKGRLTETHWSDVIAALAAIDLAQDSGRLDRVCRSYITEIDEEEQRILPMMRRALNVVQEATSH